jgi:hypothetical protein
MSARRCLIPLALALVGAGCSERLGPHPTVPPLAQAPQFVQWAGGSAPQFSTSTPQAGDGGAGLFLAAPMNGLSLDRYTATFWAVRGEQRSAQINYLNSKTGGTSPFLLLGGVEPSYVPGRGGLLPGDSVLITVTIDPTVMKVSLEPTGLLFRYPAQLQIWYGGAGGDLNGDGRVDATDAYIESQLLGMWYRESADQLWTKIPATQSLSDKSFTAALQHFSEYAVSW